MAKQLDTKSIIIIILASLLVIFTIFQPNKRINRYKDEIETLHIKNEQLLRSNDSLKIVNEKIDKELKNIYGVIKITEKLIAQYDNRITELT